MTLFVWSDLQLFFRQLVSAVLCLPTFLFSRADFVEQTTVFSATRRLHGLIHACIKCQYRDYILFEVFANLHATVRSFC